jgi:hypothetical protein
MNPQPDRVGWHHNFPINTAAGLPEKIIREKIGKKIIPKRVASTPVSGERFG